MNPLYVFALGAGVVLAGVVVYGVVKGGKTVAQAAQAAVSLVNPADSGNVVNQLVSKAGAVATGNDSFSLGSWIFDITHPATLTAEKKALGQPTDPNFYMSAFQASNPTLSRFDDGWV